ncbi:MAG: PSD1 and planctomycete cytochrome C domain-containing protein [Bryobacteraceae bacterium]|nr:PSD1 and planctomycete cytochrome C domain-containing protein [Bryobacteraceae bacterium]
MMIRFWFGLWAAVAMAAESPIAILESRCISCHAGQVVLSGLDLSSRAGALKGGNRGAAIVPGDAASLLLKVIERQGAVKMPPAGPLPAAEVAALREWVLAGAPWENAITKRSTWWSFQPVTPPAVGGVDALVAAKRGSLPAAPRASKATLIRRLAIDLTGLPPSYEEVQAFVADERPGAWSELVDRYLASPRYGEKWGRHWLDLVRYADTAGFELDTWVADAWRFRDYVIQSFNADKPYDRFVREQLAGDEFFPEDPAAVTGTGYYCVGPNRDGFPDQADINRVETLADFTDTTGAVFLGLTVGCARCHDHKYDPVSQKDYYRLQALFAPAVKTRVALNRLSSLGYDVAENTREVKLQDIGEEIGDVQQRCRTSLYEQAMAKLPAEAQAALRMADDKRTPRQRELATEYGPAVNITNEALRACLNPSEAARLAKIEERLVSLYAGYRAKPFACGVSDPGNYGPKTFIPARNGRPPELVQPGWLTILGGGEVAPAPETRENTGPIPLNATTFRRKALADWIVSPQNPLTARVIVNRVWQYHFGRGLVATPSDFGARGGPPTHPELLDWLAADFIAHGWSIKHLHRTILQSATWQQDSNGAPEAREKDPQNLLLTRYARRRLAAEDVRDSILSVTGKLNLKMYGKPVIPPLTQEEMYGMIGRPADAWPATYNEQDYVRRSIYLLQKRAFRIPMLEVFDAPEPMLSCSRRDSSTTAPQSLTLLNGAFLLGQAQSLSKELTEADNAKLVNTAWRRVLLREPTAAESARAVSFLEDQTRNAGSRQAAVAELLRGLLNLSEFLYVD